MLDRLHARLHRERTPPAYSSNSTSEQRHANTSEHESSTTTFIQDSNFESLMWRAHSNTSISTTSTILPSYNFISTTTKPPPKYTPNSTPTSSEHSQRSIQASHPLHSVPYTSPPAQYPGDALWSLGFNLSWPLTRNRHKFDTRPGKQGVRRPRREIPLDHPVHDMSADEQWNLRRRGMDPVAVAEMKMGQRRPRGRNRQYP